jgi:DNA-binding response OmpR family regulator
MASDTILVIGSDLQSRDLLTRSVKEIGYSTVVVGSLSDALALVPSLRPQAIMLDLDDVAARYLEWKYEENPYTKEPVIYLAFQGSKLVGMRGFYQSKWELGSPHNTLNIGGR